MDETAPTETRNMAERELRSSGMPPTAGTDGATNGYKQITRTTGG